MKFIISYKVAQSFNIGMNINEENTHRYTESVIEALTSGHALFEEVYEYPIHANHIISEHAPDSEKFFTYLDFKINSPKVPDFENGAQLEQLRENLIKALHDGLFDLVILWRRNPEAHIVFELKDENIVAFN